MIDSFYAPDTVKRALELCQEHGDTARFLGGGTELNSLVAPCHPKQLISLHRLGLRSITMTDRGMDQEVSIGASCTLQEMIESAAVPAVVRQACANVGNRTIRNQATIGGHIAAAHAYASVIPILVALEATVEVVTGKGETVTIPVLERIATGGRQLITAVHLPAGAMRRRAAVAEHSRSANDLAMLTVAVALTLDSGTVHDPVVVVGGIVQRVQRLAAVEQLLDGKALPPPQEIEAAVAGQLPSLDDETRASAGFKRYLAGVLVARTVADAAADRAGEGS